MKNFNSKMLLRSILAIVMVASMLLCCVACKPADNGGNGGDKEENVNKYEGLNDAEYFQALTQDTLDDTVDALAAGVSAYADLAGTTTMDDFGGTVDLTLTVGDMIIDMIEQAIFGTADSGMDMSFLSDIGLDMEIDSTSELAQLQVALGLSDTEIVALSLLVNEENVWAGAPALTDKFLEVNFADMGINVDGATAVTPTWMSSLPSIIPSEEKLAEILNRYIAMALKEIDKVERTTETLTLDDLSQEVTKLDVKIYEQDALDVVKAILTAAKADQDIKQIVENFGNFYNDMMAESYAAYDMEWTDVDAYAEFTAAVDSALTNLPAEAEDTETYIGLILYVDGNHNVVGCSLTTPAETEAVVTYYTVTEGNNFKCIAEMPDDTKLTGTGTTNNGVITGNYTISVEGTPVIKFELVDFDATKSDAISGTVRLDLGLMLETIFMTSKVSPDNAVIAAPTAQTQSSNDIFTMLGVEDVMLELTLDISGDKADVEAKLVGDDALIVGIALKLAERAPASIQKPTNTIKLTGQQSVMDLLSGMNFDSVFANLRTAGVPETLVNALESMVPAV